jgi:hypothetical protein
VAARRPVKIRLMADGKEQVIELRYGESREVWSGREVKPGVIVIDFRVLAP